VTNISHRAEIDGLRAIAVLSVILFHLGFQAFGGGYVGVDIFFVISGYLITKIIAAEQIENSFSFIDFYERRARRLLPALFFMLLITLPLSWLWMLPENLKEYSKSLIFTPIFLSNFLFFLSNGGYFEIDTQLKPLLHTWSLAVEVQYYILFPFFLIIVWRLRITLIFLLILLIGCVSLFWPYWYEKHYATTFSFYMLITRGFEILFGVLVALLSISKPSSNGSLVLNNSLSLLGFLLISFAIFTFNEKTPTPSIYSLIPVIGTCLIIVYANRESLVGRVLSSKGLVFIGMLSYSAYLWHQPIIVFSKFRGLWGESPPSEIVLMAIIFLTAYFSWRYIESPFRNKKNISSKNFVRIVLILIVFFLATGGWVYEQNGLRDIYVNRLPANVKFFSLGDKLNIKGDVCAPIEINKTAISLCNFGDISSNKHAFLYGDSHAKAISEELNKAFIDQKIKGIKVAIEGCDVIPEIQSFSPPVVDNSQRCNERLDTLLKHVGKEDVFIVTSRWSSKLYPLVNEESSEIMGIKKSLASENFRSSSSQTQYISLINGQASFSASNKRVAIKNFINRITEKTNKLMIIYPTPEVPFDIARKNISYYNSNKVLLDEIYIPYVDYLTQNQFVSSIFDEYQFDKKIIPIKTDVIFCDAQKTHKCLVQFDTLPWLLDNNHLSDVGAQLVVEQIIKNMP
jgi:peptidoglycan/LPS O-acetylase OafA/YrhL